MPLPLDRVNSYITNGQIKLHGYMVNFPINGSVALLTSGWDGFWVGGFGWIELAFDHPALFSSTCLN